MKEKMRNDQNLSWQRVLENRIAQKGPGIQKFLRAFVLMTIMLLVSMACEDGLFFNESKNSSDSQTKDAMRAAMSLPHTNLTKLDMPVLVNYALETYDCNNSPGPRIVFSGLASTGGFGVRTIFRNNMKGTHEHIEEANVDVSLLPAGSEIIVPKQPSQGGVGGNPFIWIQFVDENGQPVSEEIFIGRCVQGYTFKGAKQVDQQALASAKYQVNGCANSPGPNITFDANLSLAGLNAKIIFRNNDNPVGGPHEAQRDLATSTMTVIPKGTSWTFPKQPVLGGVGGNPWIWTQFLDGKSTAVSDEILLGRCEQLSKAL